MATQSGPEKASASQRPMTPWVAAIDKLREWEPAWADLALKITTNPWTDSVLSRRFIELVCVGLNASRTALNPDLTRRHIRAALAEGASRQEILFVLKVASVVSINSGSFNAPLLIAEASVGTLDDFGAVRKARLQKAAGAATHGVERMKALGHWEEDWDALLFLDPVWTDQYMAMVSALYTENIFPPKELELFLIAFDAAYVHVYDAGLRRHIKKALKAGATLDEIVEVLKLGVVQGVQACSLAVMVLDEELERGAAPAGE